MYQTPPLEAEPIGISHAEYLQRTFGLASKRAWCYYTPFLCSFSLPPAREVFVKEVEGSLLLLLRRQNRRGTRIDLVVPPIPFSDESLDEILARIQSLNDGITARMLWVDESDAERLGKYGLHTKLKEAEYIYDPAKVTAAEGSGYRDLRKRLRRFRREFNPEFREMAADDLPGAEEVLRDWRRKQGRRHPFLLDWGYTKKALESFLAWPAEHMRSWCVTVNRQVVAFAMAGTMQQDLASFFVAKSDPDVRGLSEYLRCGVYEELAGYRHVNDAGDLGLPGLRQFKMKFRPVSKRPVYQASSEE